MTMNIDGSMGEGGGQVLRTSLALSLITGTPIRVEKIRAGRRKPGLMRQHLAAVRAAARVGQAELEGDEVGSTELTFTPRAIAGGTIEIDIGGAGSTTLVLQTVLPALLRASAPTRVAIQGGTHNPLAPTADFLAQVFLPQLRKMGAQVELVLVRHGFSPAGGGRLECTITPSTLVPLELLQRGALVERGATALVSAISGSVAVRELARVRERLGFVPSECNIHQIRDPQGPGNVLSLRVVSENVTEVVTAFGERALAAEKVADAACAELSTYIDRADVPVGEHLADQLLLPLALAGGGVFRAVTASLHARTQAELIPRFLDRTIDVVEESASAVRFEVR